MTIQSRLWISNLILIIITILLLIGVSLVITKDFQNFIGFPPPNSQRVPTNPTLAKADRTVIKIIETNPDHLLNNEYLHQVDHFLTSTNIGLIVKKDGHIIYFSPFLEELGLNEELFRAENLESDLHPESITHLSDHLFVKKIPFYFTDKSPGTLFLVNDTTSMTDEINQFKKTIIYTLILFLIIIISINSLMTYFLSKQIVNPLIRLKNAAIQIKKGNYDFQLKSQRKDEIGELFQSFESARMQLQKSEEIKRKYEQNRNDLITNISHDLKTPMTTIKGYVEGILDEVPKSKEQQEKYLKTIHQNAIHMESLIKDLFLLSKFDLDNSLYQFENIDIKKYLSDSFEELQFDLQEKGIELKFISNYLSQQCVRADRQQLKRVILNLVNNAVHFRQKDHPRIQMMLSENEKEALIEIQDNGEGIPEKALNQIFNRFYKVDKARSDHSPGTGLGLYIAKKIISDHGGQIWAESQTGIGTSLYFTLLKTTPNEKNNLIKDEIDEKDLNY